MVVIYMLTILFRTIFLYAVLLFSVRLMGKRQIGQLQAGEFVAALLISELAAIPMTDPDIPLIYGIMPLMIIACAEVITAYLSRKSKRLRTLLDGKPITLVKNGKYIPENMDKARIVTDEVEAQARLKGYDDMKKVKTVTLEQSGDMSIIPWEEE